MLAHLIFVTLLAVAPSAEGVKFMLIPVLTLNKAVLPFPNSNIQTNIAYSPSLPQPKRVTIFYNNSVAYSFAESITSTSSIRTYANKTVTFSFAKTLPSSILLYCENWHSGNYLFGNSFAIRSKNDDRVIKTKPTSTTWRLVVPLGVVFDGILEFNLAGNKTLQWIGQPFEVDTRITFTLGILLSLLTSTTPAPTETPSADYVHYLSSVESGGVTYLKCYQMPAVLLGIHMPTLLWESGPCDRSFYTRTDCFWNNNTANGQMYYVYRYWATGAPCPQTHCCCDGVSNPGPDQWGNCATSACLVDNAPPTTFLQNWKSPCLT